MSRLPGDVKLFRIRKFGQAASRWRNDTALVLNYKITKLFVPGVVAFYAYYLYIAYLMLAEKQRKNLICFSIM